MPYGPEHHLVKIEKTTCTVLYIHTTEVYSSDLSDTYPLLKVRIDPPPHL